MKKFEMKDSGDMEGMKKPKTEGETADFVLPLQEYPQLEGASEGDTIEGNMVCKVVSNGKGGIGMKVMSWDAEGENDADKAMKDMMHQPDGGKGLSMMRLGGKQEESEEPEY